MFCSHPEGSSLLLRKVNNKENRGYIVAWHIGLDPGSII